ncbi:E3 ubiquitin-protein ligase Topors isoform X2 [Jatropha curcas]|uniref:E3 ubiquitin-protein ligase Topors isoform X2 n=1 Tax=Jatropha curcas TaxID=180498 RepID=UPI0005FB536E|nr:E3 ubiquitin-protein ligase Topors isoform X2 [Jatropha curcas]
MDSSSVSSSSSRNSEKHDLNREKFLLRVIWPAIRGQTCPICLKDLGDHRRTAVITVCLHAYCLRCIRKWSDLKRKCPLCNAAFDSLFYKISFSSRNFLTEKLRALKEGKIAIVEPDFSSRVRQQMMRSRPLPWRRTFGRPGSVPSDVIAERKLQWRASVYKRSLQAVPSSPEQVSRDGYLKERVLQKIEPWIKRELQAILEDPDPSVIIHVASSLYIASLEGNFDVQAAQHGVEDNFLAPLRPFLHNWTNMFWHELRCFAETSLAMETYDAVVTYKRFN